MSWSEARIGPNLLAALPTGTEVLNLFLLFALVAGLALGGLYLAVAIRRWTQRDERAQNFTVQDLREMRARGEISEREFTAMRAALLAQVQAFTADSAGDVDPSHGRPDEPDSDSGPAGNDEPRRK